LLRKKQLLGILGIIFAIAGGVSWFFQATISALMLWGIAIIILFKLRRKEKL
jgi:4-hydroxybenzoate polyprenyltransferase